MDIDSTQNKVETAADLVRMSFKETAARLSTWQKTHKKNLNWANYKSTEINHILRIPAFSVANVHTGGNTGIVNATSRAWTVVAHGGVG